MSEYFNEIKGHISVLKESSLHFHDNGCRLSEIAYFPTLVGENSMSQEYYVRIHSTHIGKKSPDDLLPSRF